MSVNLICLSWDDETVIPLLGDGLTQSFSPEIRVIVTSLRVLYPYSSLKVISFDTVLVLATSPKSIGYCDVDTVIFAQ